MYILIDLSDIYLSNNLLSGWLGIVMLSMFCALVAYSGTRLGISWVILEERWPEYRQPVRQPYMEIGYRSLGKIGR